MMLRTQRWRRLTTLRLVRPRAPETGTLRNAFFQSPYEFFCERGFSSGVSSDRYLSYGEKLRSGLVDIKRDDAVDLFRSMIRSCPLSTVIDFNRLFSAVARTKEYDLVFNLELWMKWFNLI
ncbi:hypothetical protein Bca4012_008852 [Brassica carinata]